MLFSIITPSYNQPSWLRLCLASVADQGAKGVEHIIQDNQSGPKVADVLRGFPSVRCYREADKGMYDAVNRGLRRSRGEICAYLNCDEQYLPGTLAKVETYFKRHPETEVLFGDIIVVDGKGRYLCSRQGLKPLKWHTRTCFLNTFTAAMFFRRSVFEKRGLYFDASLRDLGDADWVLRALGAGVRMDVMRSYLAAFVDTGDNMNMRPNARRELREMHAAAPVWMRWGAPLWLAHHRMRRLVHGLYSVEGFSYRIYIKDKYDPNSRKEFEVAQGRSLWRSRLSCHKT